MWHLTTLLLAAAPLSFDAAITLADESAVIAGAQRATNERRAAVTGLSPLPSNPQLSLQPGFRTLPNQAAGPEGFVVLSQAFNLGGLAGARRAVASGEADASAAAVNLQRAELRVAVARAWLDGWTAQRALAALEAEQAGAEEVVSRLARASKAGAVTRVEAASVRAFAAELKAQALAWKEKRLEARLQLASLLSLREPPELREEPPELARPTLPALREDRLPHVKLIDAERRLELLRAKEVAAQWAPQLQASLQFGHEWQGQWIGAAGLGITLPVFERGQREAASHRAESLRLEGVLTQARADAEVALRRLEHELEHSEEVLEVVRGEQLPAALEAAELEQLRSTAGEATLVELIFLRRLAVAARIAATLAEADVLAARHRAAELLRLHEVSP